MLTWGRSFFFPASCVSFTSYLWWYFGRVPLAILNLIVIGLVIGIVPQSIIWFVVLFKTACHEVSRSKVSSCVLRFLDRFSISLASLIILFVRCLTLIIIFLLSKSSLWDGALTCLRHRWRLFFFSACVLMFLFPHIDPPVGLTNVSFVVVSAWNFVTP